MHLAGREVVKVFVWLANESGAKIDMRQANKLKPKAAETVINQDGPSWAP